jgi:hypothetical protein
MRERTLMRMRQHDGLWTRPSAEDADVNYFGRPNPSEPSE